MYEKNSHCSYCGAGFPVGLPWPRRCAACGKKSYLNPVPVAVVLVPVDDGVLVVRRSVPPREGMLALPGGFIMMGESWQEAGAREVFEETGLQLSPGEIEEFGVRSAPDGTVLIFGIVPRRASSGLAPFAANDEATEMLVLSGPTELAFPLHTEILARYFALSKIA